MIANAGWTSRWSSDECFEFALDQLQTGQQTKPPCHVLPIRVRLSPRTAMPSHLRRPARTQEQATVALMQDSASQTQDEVLCGSWERCGTMRWAGQQCRLCLLFT